MTAFVANSNVLELQGLKDSIDDSFINDASVTVTVKDAQGTNVDGETWPLGMSYVTASDGNYRCIIAADLDFEPKAHYTAFIEVDAGANRIGHWEFKFRPATRSSVDS